MARKIAVTEVIEGYKIEICPNAAYNLERIRKTGYLDKIAEACWRHGYKRAVLGTMGDASFGYMGSTSKLLALDTMHVVKFLKR